MTTFCAQEQWLVGIPSLDVEPQALCKLQRMSEESLLTVLRPLQLAFPPAALHGDCLFVQADIPGTASPADQRQDRPLPRDLKARMNLLVYTSPDELHRTMQEFIDYYNHRRYHEAIGNATPADVYYGRREEILRRREQQKQRTIQERLRYNLGRSHLKLTGEPKSKV